MKKPGAFPLEEGGVTSKQRAFVAEYIKDFNASAAARRATANAAPMRSVVAR